MVYIHAVVLLGCWHRAFLQTELSFFSIPNLMPPNYFVMYGRPEDDSSSVRGYTTCMTSDKGVSAMFIC